MNLLRLSLACTAALIVSTAIPALAASTAGSSASDSASSAASSASDSLKNSSGGSSKATGVTQGDYKITDVAVAADRPGTMRLTLQAVAETSPTGEFFLYVPTRLFDQGELNVGQTIAARTRPYGVEFAKGERREAFLFVLDDEVFRELNSVAVAL